MSAKPWDFIVVGAGSAGCALAARLTESGAHRVLLIKAGDDDRWMWLRIPTGVAKIMVGERALWRFHTESEPGAWQAIQRKLALLTKDGALPVYQDAGLKTLW